MADAIGFEPIYDGIKARCRTRLATHQLQFVNLVQSIGVEPISSDFQSAAITVLAHFAGFLYKRFALVNSKVERLLTNLVIS